MRRRLSFASFSILFVCYQLYGGSPVSIVDFPAPGSNSFYIGNQAPLAASRLISLPPGCIEPRGWLLETLRRQRDGLCGHLGEISAWLEKADNAWLSKTGQGEHGWEEVPYWLRGYIQLAYIFKDPAMIAESRTWIEGALQSQQADGDFGPRQKFEDGSRDYWANMLMMFSLETYYEHSHDGRALRFLSNYFQYQLSVPDDKFLTHYWQKMRGGDNLYSVYWLYNRTREPFLLDLAQKIHRCAANWEMPNDLPNWHNVNIAESFREPAVHFLQTRDSSELQATYADFREVRRRYGQVPGGMFGGDENCRPGYTDPHQAIETCGMVEQMFSDELLEEITGDCFWADNCEDVAFNTYPAALAPDLRSLRYLTAPNMVLSDAANHAPGLQNSGPFLLMNPFSSRCCQHNHSMGWPAFNNHLWMATPDNGLCAVLYAAGAVEAQVAAGAVAKIEEETQYPFDGKIFFAIHPSRAGKFPLYFRIPGWCEGASVSINGKRVRQKLPRDKFVRLERAWKDGDSVILNLPMTISTRDWKANHNSVSIDRGPLTFSLEIGEQWKRCDSSRNAIFDSGWQKSADPSEWPSFEIHPTTPWNYGLALDSGQFKVETRNWPADNFPFTPEGSPIRILAKARRIPSWTLDEHGLCGALPDSPVKSDQPLETVTLIPMGAARLRVSAFPVVTQASP